MKTIGLEEYFIMPELFGYRASTKNGEATSRVLPGARAGDDFLGLRIPEMDEHGLDAQVLSLTTPGIQAEKDTRVAITNALKVNDFLKTVIDEHPTRFGGFAALPLQLGSAHATRVFPGCNVGHPQPMAKPRFPGGSPSSPVRARLPNCYRRAPNGRSLRACRHPEIGWGRSTLQSGMWQFAKPVPPRTTGNIADQNPCVKKAVRSVERAAIGKSKRKSRNISTEAPNGRLSPIREDTVVRIITLEDHFASPMFQERFPQGNVPGHFLADRGRYLGYDISAELLNLGDSRLAAMDAAGIDVQVVSLTMPGCEAFDGETAIAMATDANNRLAEAIQAHPGRLAGFASLPTANPAIAAKELERAVTKLGLKGALINGHVRGEFLDNRKYWVIFECAQALNVPIYLHPTVPHPDVLKAYFDGYVELATPAWGFAMDTCTHFLRLVFAGLFDACPNLKMILGHLGEGLPFWIHRLNDHTQFAAKRRGLKKAPEQYLRENLVVTTSGNFFAPAFLCTLLALGVDNVLFSVDWPYESNRIAADWLNHLQISEPDKEKICHLNAERVLHL